MTPSLMPAQPLNSTTIDLCLAVSPRAHFRTTKAAVKMHTLLDLRGNATNQSFIPLLPILGRRRRRRDEVGGVIQRRTKGLLGIVG